MNLASYMPWRWGKATRKAKQSDVVRGAVSALMARYDAAQTTDANRRHWAMADGLSANSANSPSVRETLRNRSRYECGNNCYARGLVQTVANHTVGTGPRLQIRTGNREHDKIIKKSTLRWMREISLAEKLRTMVQARVSDGEGFGVKITNPKLNHPVKLDLRLFEAELCASPYGLPNDARRIDGIILDEYQNVDRYEILKHHPGDSTIVSNPWDSTEVPSRNIVHLYRCVRPGQLRGVPEITPALPLFAQLRRYTLAVIASAEIAALISLFLKTTGQVTPDQVTAWTSFDYEARAGVVLPDGWDIGQVDSKQPVTTYAEFKREILNEIGRCMDMPANIMTCDSSGYNFASGKLDHQTYGKMIAIDRKQIEDVVLTPMLQDWIREAMLIGGVIPDGVSAVTEWDWEWHWDAMSPIDPYKEESARDIRLRNGTSSLAHELDEEGYDWESIVESQAECLNVTFEEMQEIILGALYSGAIPQPDETDPDEESGSSDGVKQQTKQAAARITDRMNRFRKGATNAKASA